LNLADVDVELYDMTGKKVSGGTINKGSTLVYLDTRRSYAGTYVVRLKSGSALQSSKIVLVK
jgi:hypothetical protein